MKPDGHVHTVPLEKEHIESKDCWCEPTLEYEDPETGCKHYLHKELQ